MGNDKNLKVWEKLRIAREKMGVPQEKIAEAIALSNSSLSDLELGKTQKISQDIIWTIKVALKLENVPFTDQEYKYYGRKLSEFRELIVAKKLDEAEIMQKQLADILLVPFNIELQDLYNLFYCKLLLKLGNNEEAENIMAALDVDKYKTDSRFMYNYFYNKGALSYSNAEYKQAYKFFDTARSYMKDGFEQNTELHFALATCETALGNFNCANKFLVRGRELYSSDKVTVPELAVDTVLAVNYIRMKDIEEAKKALDRCYNKALLTGDKFDTGNALLNYGFLYEQAGYYPEAIKYLDDTFEYFEKGSIHYIETLYRKSRCFTWLGRYNSCSPLIAEGKELSEGNKKYTILFRSLECLAALNNPDSLKYLETIAIPSLLEIGVRTVVLDYCEVLLKYYEGQDLTHQKRKLYLADIARNIYKDMYRGGELEWEKIL